MFRRRAPKPLSPGAFHREQHILISYVVHHFCFHSCYSCLIRIQDEKHVLFFCKCAEVCELRMRYRDLFEGMFKTLRAFAPSSSEFITFLACHRSITDYEINAFLNQDSYFLQTEVIHGLTRFYMRFKIYLHLNSFWMPYDLVRLLFRTV
jgi:hypothetical protein